MYACLMLALVTSVSGGNRDLMFRYGSSGEERLVAAPKVDSLNLRRVGSWSRWAGTFIAHVVTVDGNYCYLGWGCGVSVLDVSDPTDPKDVSRIFVTSPFAPADVFIDDTLLYVADYAYVWIHSIADPAQPRELGKYEPPGSGESPTGVVASGSVAYVATQSSGGADPRGIRVLDVSDPSNISELAYLPMANSTGRLYLEEDYLYVADWSVILHVVDISTPSAPVDLGEVDLGGFISDQVCVEGDYAFVAAQTGGTQIADISNPSSPQYYSYIWSTGMTYGVHVENSLAYIADYTGGVRVRNVADPMSTVETGYYVHPSKTMGAHHSNGYVYAALSDSALLVLQYYGPQGIEEKSNYQLTVGNGQLSVHPNPFTHNTVVEFRDVETPYMVSLQIHDLSGRFVRSVSIHDSRFTIDALEPGIYFVKADGYKPVKITKIR